LTEISGFASVHLYLQHLESDTFRVYIKLDNSSRMQYSVITQSGGAKMSKFVAIYVRTSTAQQDTRSQKADLDAYAARSELPVQWFTDKSSGTTMDRPAFNRLMESARRGEVASIVVWRLDRLGRTARGLVSLFEELREYKINLVSLKDSLDLSTPAGRLMGHVLASVAAYETEVRGERQAAGIAAAKAEGKVWGGRKEGALWKVTSEQIQIARTMKTDGKPIALIARTLQLSRPTVYRILAS
jgi:DNA invertase Pin-like site-specific DNA recombinase